MLVAVALLVSACGWPPAIDSSAEQAIKNVVARQTKLRATDVRCPDGIIAALGLSFTCTYRAVPGNVLYRAQLRITEVRRGEVIFFVITQPAQR
jgi:hypothetical protein